MTINYDNYNNFFVCDLNKDVYKKKIENDKWHKTLVASSVIFIDDFFKKSSIYNQNNRDEKNRRQVCSLAP